MLSSTGSYPFLPPLSLPDALPFVQVAGPGQGRSSPGMTIVGVDSHTSTHGAFGALAFGIGTSEGEQVLATQTIRQRRSRNMRVTVEGSLAPHVHAKDLALHLLGAIGVDGAGGHVIEYAGDEIGRAHV